jgi:hypothetical protein
MINTVSCVRLWIWFSSLVFLRLNSDFLHAEDSNFLQAVRNFQSSRDSIVSYCVKIEGLSVTSNSIVDPTKGKSSNTSPNQIGVDDGVVKFQEFTKFTIEAISDVANDRHFFCYNAEPLLPGLTTSAGTDFIGTSQAYLVDGAVGFTYSEGRFKEVKDLRAIPVPDPLAIGSGFCAEAKAFFSFTEISNNLRSFGQIAGKGVVKWTESREGSIETFRQRFPFDRTQSTTLFSFDAQRGYMLTKREAANIDRQRKLVPLVLNMTIPKKVGSIWFPGYVAYQCNESSFRAFWLDFFSVNDAIPEDFFRPEILELLLTSNR